MAHKIAFLLTRSAELKVYAPIITAAILRGEEVFLLCGPDPVNSWPGIPLYRPLKENMRFPGDDEATFLSFKNDAEANKLLQENNIEHFFILRYRPDQLPYQLDLINTRKYKIHVLQFMADLMFFSPQYLNNIDNLYVYSPKMIELYQEVYPDANKKMIAEKFVVLGNPAFDKLSEIQSDHESIRKKYGLPTDKPIVLLMSLGLGTTPWRQYVFGATNFLYTLFGAIYTRQWRLLRFLFHHPRQHHIIKVIKNWTHKNNAIFVVKSRAKHNEPRSLIKQADFFITDTSTWYPYPSIELMSIADLVIQFHSTSVLESAASDVYTLAVDLSSNDNPLDKGEILQNSTNKNDGVITEYDYRKIESLLARHNLADYHCDPAKRQEFISTFTGPLNSDASNKILDHALNV